jgi:hypothetical protein
MRFGQSTSLRDRKDDPCSGTMNGPTLSAATAKTLQREVLPPRRDVFPAGEILLSTATMLLAIAASTLLVSERARDRTARPPSLDRQQTTMYPVASQPTSPDHPRCMDRYTSSSPRRK